MNERVISRMPLVILVVMMLGLVKASEAGRRDVASHPTLKEGLIAWYGFDGTFDDSHAGLNARVANGAPGFGRDRFGKRNRAFSSSGGNALAVTGIDISGGSFSIQFWALEPQNWFLGQGVREDNLGLHIGAEGSSGLRCDYWGNDLRALTPPAAEWTHWVITHDGASRKKIIWHNGQPAAEILTSPYAGHGDFIIGRHFSGGGYFVGRLDDVAVWSRALTPQEVSDLYAKGKGLVYGKKAARP